MRSISLGSQWPYLTLLINYVIILKKTISTERHNKKIFGQHMSINLSQLSLVKKRIFKKAYSNSQHRITTKNCSLTPSFNRHVDSLIRLFYLKSPSCEFLSGFYHCEANPIGKVSAECRLTRSVLYIILFHYILYHIFYKMSNRSVRPKRH